MKTYLFLGLAVLAILPSCVSLPLRERSVSKSMVIAKYVAAGKATMVVTKEYDEPVRFELQSADGKIIRPDETMIDGFCLFPDVPPGEYIVREAVFPFPRSYGFVKVYDPIDFGTNVLRFSVTKPGVLFLGERFIRVKSKVLNFTEKNVLEAESITETTGKDAENKRRFSKLINQDAKSAGWEYNP